MYKRLCCSYELLSGLLCALWECPHASSGGGDLDHVLPLPSPRVLVHLVPGPEHGAVLLLLHVLLTAGRETLGLTTQELGITARVWTRALMMER